MFPLAAKIGLSALAAAGVGLGSWFVWKKKPLPPEHQAALDAGLASTNAPAVASLGHAMTAAGHDDAASQLHNHAAALRAAPHGPDMSRLTDAQKAAHAKRRAELLLALSHKKPGAPTGKTPAAPKPNPSAPQNPIQSAEAAGIKLAANALQSAAAPAMNALQGAANDAMGDLTSAFNGG